MKIHPNVQTVCRFCGIPVTPDWRSEVDGKPHICSRGPG